MIQSPEERVAVLERQLRDLTARVNKLEYANMTLTNMANQPWPAPVPEFTMCIAQAEVTEASWPFPKGLRP